MKITEDQKNKQSKTRKTLRKLDKDFVIYTTKVVLGTALASLFMRYIMEKINFTDLPMIPFFACVGVMVAMDQDLVEAVKNVITRNIGTVVAGVVGGIIASFTQNIFLISLGIIPLFLFLNLIDRRESILPGGIFYFAIAYLTTFETAWMYALNRTLGTILGTLIGLAINFLIFPPKSLSKKEK